MERNFFRDFDDFGFRDFGPRRRWRRRNAWDEFDQMEQHMNNMFNRIRNFERRFFRDFEGRNNGRVEENKK